MKNMTIHLKDFSLNTFIGVYDDEKDVKTPLTINLDLDVLYPVSDFKDNVTNVLNYADIRNGVIALTDKGHINLLETLAEKICLFVFSYDVSQFVSVEITKPEIFDDIGAVGISMDMTRTEFEQWEKG